MYYQNFTFLVWIVSALRGLRTFIINATTAINMAIAKLFGYPANNGMPFIPPVSWDWGKFDPERDYRSRLEIHRVPFPPQGQVTNFYEIYCKPLPKVATITKHFYQSDDTGYYSFYMQSFKNSLFLPNWLSEFLQIQLGFCVDLSGLESAKQGLFFILVYYCSLIYLRGILYWYIELNPYFGLLYFPCAMVDWFEDIFGGYIPNVFGLNLSLTIMNMIFGKVTDYLNHLSFTMPYLPSEGIRERVLIEGERVYILNFKYLPYLWYKHPIPNEIRQFWILERPDILTYMQKSYGRLGIDLLPDAALKYANDNPDLKIQSTLFKKLPSKVAEELKTLSFVGSPLDIELPDVDVDLDLDLDLMNFFHCDFSHFDFSHFDFFQYIKYLL